MRYVSIERGSTESGDLIMDEALAYVNYRLCDDEQVLYEPTWLLVAQWDGVHPHPHGAENRKGLDEDYLEQVSGVDENLEWSHTQLMICHYVSIARAHIIWGSKVIVLLHQHFCAV